MRSLLLPHNTPTTLSAFTLSTEAASTQAMHLNRRIFIKCDLSFPLSLSSFLVYSPLYSTISYRQGFREITASFSILDSPAYTHKNKERERDGEVVHPFCCPLSLLSHLALLPCRNKVLSRYKVPYYNGYCRKATNESDEQRFVEVAVQQVKRLAR